MPSSDTAIEGRSLNLTCDTAGAIAFSLVWSKDGIGLGPSGNVLTLASLKRSDAGIYTCEVSNPISSRLATYALNVSCTEPDRLRFLFRTGPEVSPAAYFCPLRWSGER